MRRLAPLLCLLLFSACAAPPCAIPVAAFSRSEAPLVAAMARRLALAREVAWIKYLDTLPIRDAKREAAVLDEAAAAAAARGLNTGTARGFFAAQIAASCAEQETAIYLWRRGAPLPTYAPRSLRGGVRRDIDIENRALLDALAGLAQQPAEKDFRARAERALRSEGFSGRTVRLATAPL